MAKAVKPLKGMPCYPGSVFGAPSFRCMPPCDFSSSWKVKPIFTKDGRFLITPGPDLTICVWDVATGALNRSLTERTRYDTHAALKALALSADETKIAAVGFGSGYGQIGRVFNFNDGTELLSAEMHAEELYWLPDSQHLLLFNYLSGYVEILNTASGTITHTLRTPEEFGLAGAALEAGGNLVIFLRSFCCGRYVL